MQLTRRPSRTVRPVLAATLGPLLLAPAALAGGEGKRPNIVWFICEDMGPDLGCYGEPQADTPHLDRLADSGMRYTNAFTTAPVCSPSRSSFMTGMYPTSIDAHHHRSHRITDHALPAGVRVITDWLRPAGYHTATPWKAKRDWNFDYHGKAGKDRPYDSRDWSSLKANQPFFAQVQVSESHRSFHGPRRADPDKVEVPPYYPDHPKVRKDWARYLDSVAVADRKFGKMMKKLKADGLLENTIIFMFADHGRAMVRGKQWPYDSGLGIPLLVRWPQSMDPPKHYEAGTVSDRLVSAIDITATTLWAAGVEPPMTMQGRVIYGDRADKLTRQYAFGGRGRGDETEFRMRTVRTKEYRYIRSWHPERPFLQRNAYKERAYPVIDLMRKLHFQEKLKPAQEKLLAPDRPEEELYHIPSDPYEIHNLADSDKAEHRAALRRLRSVLDAWMVETNDQGRFPEDPKVLKHWQTRFDKRFKQWAKNHPEKHARYKKLQREWERTDDDNQNTSRRPRVWEEESPE